MKKISLVLLFISILGYSELNSIFKEKELAMSRVAKKKEI